VVEYCDVVWVHVFDVVELVDFFGDECGFVVFVVGDVVDDLWVVFGCCL